MHHGLYRGTPQFPVVLVVSVLYCFLSMFSLYSDSNIGKMKSIFILPLTPKHTDTQCQFSSANGELAQIDCVQSKAIQLKTLAKQCIF